MLHVAALKGQHITQYDLTLFLHRYADLLTRHSALEGWHVISPCHNYMRPFKPYTYIHSIMYQ